MANGGHDWWELLWQYTQGAIAAIATAASSAVGWMAYRYRKYVGLLIQHERRIKRHRRVLNDVLQVLKANENGQKNARAIERCNEAIKQIQDEMDALNSEVGKYSDLTAQVKGAMDAHILTLQGVTRELQQMQARFDMVFLNGPRRNADK